MGGTSEYEGRVEVCVNKAWGTVCAYNSWSSDDAKVVCNHTGALTLGTSEYSQINYTMYYAHHAGYTYSRVGSLGFSQGSGPILLGYLYCNGQEANLLECNQNYNSASTSSGCQNHYYDAAVKCERKLS